MRPDLRHLERHEVVSMATACDRAAGDAYTCRELPLAAEYYGAAATLWGALGCTEASGDCRAKVLSCRQELAEELAEEKEAA